MTSNTRIIPSQTKRDPEDADIVTVPLCGGIFKDESGSTEIIVPWVGTDSDSNIQNYTWDQDNERWMFIQNYLTGLSQRLKVLIIQDNSDH